jgi:hypothetical protein
MGLFAFAQQSPINLTKLPKIPNTRNVVFIRKLWRLLWVPVKISRKNFGQNAYINSLIGHKILPIGCFLSSSAAFVMEQKLTANNQVLNGF